MFSPLLKLCVLALVLSVVLATPHERERRASRFYRIAKKVRGVFSWMLPSRYSETDTVEKEAEIVLIEVEKSISKGKQLVTEGEQLLKKADELELSLGADVDKRDDDTAQAVASSKRTIIQTLRDAAQRIIATGTKIISNSMKISAALREAAGNVTDVVAEGVADVGPAIVDLSDSLTRATLLLAQAKATAVDISNGVGDTVDKLETVSKLAVEAGKTFQDVSQDTATLVQKIYKLGQKLFQVIKNAAKAIYKAAGFSGRK